MKMAVLRKPTSYLLARPRHYNLRSRLATWEGVFMRVISIIAVARQNHQTSGKTTTE
jgi:hypothetical protein